MHEPRPHPQAPQRGCTELVRGVLELRCLDYASRRFQVMQQEVTVGMNDLVAECCGNHERATIEDSAGLRGHNRLDVTGVATELEEELLACDDAGARTQSGVARRDLRAANELGEVIDIGETESIGLVFGIGCHFAQGGCVGHAQTAGDTHFVQIGVGDE